MTSTTEAISIQTDKQTHTLKKDEYARWLCLLEAIDMVERKAEELKADLANDDFWVKPLAFQKYIDQRFETMVLDIEREEFNVDIKEKLKVMPVIEQIEPVEEEAEPDFPLDEELATA